MIDFCALCPACSEAIRLIGAGCTGTCPTCIDIYYQTDHPDPEDFVDEMLEAEAEYLAEVTGDLEAVWPPIEDLADQAQDASAEAFLAVMDERAARADTPGGTR